MMGLATAALSSASGVLVGLVLGLIGGGGSILALPLLVYVVGYQGDPHAAIGTAALAVAASAFANLVQHRRQGHVRLRAGLWFALPGVAGALLGAALGLLTRADALLFLFAVLMLVVAWRLWTSKDPPPRDPDAPHAFRRPLVALVGFAVGALSGFFGIGGGFLIVPALLWVADLDMREAIGTSLLAVAAFGLTTAARYGVAGKLDVPLAVVFIMGGVLGGYAGTRLSHRAPRARLRLAFAALLVPVAAYMLYRNLGAFA